MNRIDREFEILRKENKKALVPFVTFDKLTKEELAKLVIDIREAGANIVEIGIPFSEPLADGEIIQKAYTNALNRGISIKDVFDTVDIIRRECEIPIVVMVYYNLVYCYGIERFLNKAMEVGIDGLIIPDLPLEERKEVLNKSIERNIYLIPLVAPTSKDRIKKIIESGNGFIYCISSMGVTGERNEILNKSTINYLNYVKEESSKPFLVGFGISNSKIAKEICKYCDGIIVGSSIVKRINDDKVIDFIKEIRREIDLE